MRQRVKLPNSPLLKKMKTHGKLPKKGRTRGYAIWEVSAVI